MKSLIVSLALMISVSAVAQEQQCTDAAVRVAHENSHLARILRQVTVLESQPDTEAYMITLASSFRSDALIEVVSVALKKNDCSVVTVLPGFGK